MSYLENIRKKLNKFEGSYEKAKVFVGFDGYVDSLVKPIKGMCSGEPEFFHTIEEFGTYLCQKGHKSCSIELHKVQDKAGGNAPNFSKALSEMGLPVLCIGAFGYPDKLRLFADLEESMEIVSITNPGYCTALEFEDGKVMLADNADLNSLDYELLQKRVGEGKLLSYFEESDIISLMNWSEVPGCTGIWNGILEHIFPQMQDVGKKKIFIDLSDCSRRGREEILEMLKLLLKFTSYCEVILSLNCNELECIYQVLKEESKLPNIEDMGKVIQHYSGVSSLAVHLLEGAYAFESEGAVYIENRLVENPMISTGGGDNFNAGLLLGILADMELPEAVTVANLVSGFYVSYGRSPKLREVYEEVCNGIKEKEKRA